MEESGEEAAKIAAPVLLRHTATSLLPARRISSKHSKQNESQFEDNYSTRYEYVSFSNEDIPMEDYYMNNEDLGYSIEIGRSSQIINEDSIKNILVEHARRMNCRSQLYEDMEKMSKMDKSNIESFLAACEPHELNVLLLYASYVGRADLIRRLCEHEVNVDYAEPDHSLTALHLCAFRNCLDGVQQLVARDAKVNFREKHNPFYYAVLGDSYDVAHYFVQQGINHKFSQDKETMLHVAARQNAHRVLSLLVNNDKELKRLGSDGFAAIHYAADVGNLNCLHVLLKAGCPVDLPTRKNDTALHMAARSHNLECVKVLLENDADPNAENENGCSSLHLALSCSLVTDDIVELLLIKNANVNKADNEGNTPLHIASSKELSRCVNLLIMHDADFSAKTNDGTSALFIVLHKTPTCLDVLERKLDASVAIRRQGFVAGELELQLNFGLLLQHRQDCEIGYLETFVREGYTEILEHPLCQSFLHLKWQKIRKFYVVRLLFYLVYMLILMSWVMVGLTYHCYNESHGRSHNDLFCNATTTGLYGFFYSHPTVLEIHWYILVMLTLLEVVRALTVMSSYQIRQFFTQTENLMTWCVILNVITTFVYGGRTYRWQSYTGAFAVLCGWFNLMLMIGQLPMFGPYVAMFTSVQAQVFKLLLTYICLLVGFTVCFCVFFPHTMSFGQPHMVLAKVLVMMTGNINFDEFFFPSKETINETPLKGVKGVSWVFLQIFAELCFVLFVLFVTIVLMNLLIAIAVHDIEGLQKSAGLVKLVHQTKLIYDVETIFALLPKRLLKCLRWFALIRPSPTSALMIVRPLCPTEKRLPRHILSAAYEIAKKGECRNNFTMSHKKIYGPSRYIRKAMKTFPSTACRRNDFEENMLTRDCKKLKDDNTELRKMCEEILRELAKIRDAIK